MYTTINFKSKKALKDAIAEGRTVRVYHPNGDFFNAVPPRDGKVCLEGPHGYHTWYATATLKEGVIVKVR